MTLRVLPLLRDDSKIEELKARYLDLADKIRPLASALEGVVIRLPDEAKKLKNLQSWLKTLRRVTRPDIFDDAEPDPKSVEENRERVYKQFVLPGRRYYLFDDEGIESVTDYGKTNVGEDFAEVFAYIRSQEALESGCSSSVGASCAMIVALLS
mgnify:CR=1 FL=1